MSLMSYIRGNHFAMMAVCCMLPVLFIVGLQLAGITGWLVYPLALVACLGGHALMMALPSKDGKASCH